jgi:hypothetical protein
MKKIDEKKRKDIERAERLLRRNANADANAESTKLVITNTEFIDDILRKQDALPKDRQEPTVSSNIYMPNIALLNHEKKVINENFFSYMQTIIPQMRIALSDEPFISEVIVSNPMCSSILTNLQSYFNLSTDVQPPVPPEFPNHPDLIPVYDNYLNNFKGHNIFTLKSDMFQPDQLCDIGRWNDPKEHNSNFNKYYEPNDFDTK